jgi:HAD superfamily hydrolase (TIGR01509 family)
MFRALVFDFDGLILETEGPSYQSWLEVYQSFGYGLPFSTWSTIIGTTRGDFDPRLELQRLVKDGVDWEGVELRRQASENELIVAQAILPGVETYLRDARRLGLKIGLASSSSCQWVVGHLSRLGLSDYFDCICASDDVQRIKPDPELYLSVLRGLEVGADEAIALEDSPIGIRAAKGAGLYCVAVPNALTSQLELSQADFQLPSLAAMPLEQLLHKIEVIKTQRAAL